MPQSGPWEKYANMPQGQDDGPWAKYAARQAPNAGLAPAAQPNIQMQESKVPTVARAVTGALPAVGGIGGGLLGAPAGGFGGLLGAGLGAAGGETARQAINRTIFGKDEVSPISKQGLQQTALAGGTAAAMEIPGAVMTTAGKMLLPRIAAAKSAKEVGDAVQGIMESDAGGFTRTMLLRDVKSAGKANAKALRQSLSSSTSVADVDQALASARQEAQAADATLKGTSRRFDRLIAAAKINARIAGKSKVSAQEMFDFMQQLQKPGFRGSPGPNAEVLGDLAKQAYRDSGQQIRTIVPESDQLLRNLTNLHAAESAIKGYKPSRMASLAVSAAIHPRTAAAVSPLAAIGLGAVGNKAVESGKSLASEFTH